METHMPILTLGQLLGPIAIIVASGYCISIFVAWYRLRHLPGPFLASLSSIWYALLASSGGQYEGFNALFEKHGGLVRIGPNLLVTNDPEVISGMTGHKSTWVRDDWYKGGRIDPYHTTMFSMVEPKSHDRVKARLARAYSGRETESLEPGVDSQIVAMIALLRRKYLNGTTSQQGRFVDMAQLSNFFTLDVITRAAYGEAIGFLTRDADMYEFCAEVRKSWVTMTLMMSVPFLRRIVFSSPVLKLLGPKHTDSKGVGRMMRVAKEATERRFAGDLRKEKNMIASFARSGLDQRACEGEALFVLLAGSETTAVAMRSTILYIITNPRVHRDFRKMIVGSIRDGTVSSPITVAEAKRIPYLQAVILEGLRIRTPSQGLMPKVVPPEGVNVHGKYVPGGTAIGLGLGSALRTKSVFGDDAELFRPERFLEADEATRAKMESTVMLQFGAGRWACAGQPLAFMELNKVFFELLRHFDFEVVNPVKPFESINFNVLVDQFMWMRVTEANLD
ncbi:BcABA1, cytochrome P450 monooxygenase [Xylariaceae sp. FL0016]|nr:BcABA1, cytochrome P450 monooxygenase [Xylariaceae sp. FL0016]